MHCQDRDMIGISQSLERRERLVVSLVLRVASMVGWWRSLGPGVDHDQSGVRMRLEILFQVGQATLSQTRPIERKLQAMRDLRLRGEQLLGACLQPSRVLFKRQVEHIPLRNGFFPKGNPS